jgi:hypothetical protein
MDLEGSISGLIRLLSRYLPEVTLKSYKEQQSVQFGVPMSTRTRYLTNAFLDFYCYTSLAAICFGSYVLPYNYGGVYPRIFTPQ